MKNKHLLNIIGEIDDRHIAEAVPVAEKPIVEKVTYSKRRWVVVLVAAVMSLCLIGAGVAVSQYIDSVKSPDPFEGVEYHALSADGDLEVSEAIENNEILVIPQPITTNKEQIVITNNSSVEIIVFLYSDNNLDEAIREMKLAANETKTFTGLSSRFLYNIGVKAADTEQINVIVSD